MSKLLLLAVFIFHTLILSRLIFTAWPEMLSYPYLFSNGFVLYKDFIMPYPPTLPFLLSLIFNIFGFNPYVLKIFTWILILGIDFLLYMVLKKITQNNQKSLIFLALFTLLQSFLEGNMLWFDLTTVPPLLLAFFFILKWLEKKKIKDLFLVGLFLSLTIIVKQIALIYLFGFLFFYLISTVKINPKEITGLCFGLIVPFIPLGLYLFFTNSFLQFWNWTIYYPLFEWSKFPGYVNFAISKRYVLVTFLLLLSLLTGLFLAFKKIIRDKVTLLAFIFLITTLIAVYPRFSFFHLQPALVFIIILLARFFIQLPARFKLIQTVLIFTTTFIIMNAIFPTVAGKGIRFYSETDKTLGQQIQKLVKPNERIFLLGLDSSLYVFSNHLPSKRWSDNFGWYLEVPKVQEWVLEGFESDPPQFIFRRIPSEGRWFDLGTYQPQKILNYIFLNYKKEGIIDGEVELWIRKN